MGDVVGAAVRRTEAHHWLHGAPLAAGVPRVRRQAPAGAGPGACAEIDCIRHLLPHRVIGAMLRLLSATLPRGATAAPVLGDDRELPVYTIICALYRGIMAQTPQALL
ncbi:MAG: hypothetical protein ABSE22_11645 [Xanthobacteraceae bacterium]